MTEGPRACAREELQELVDLANRVFRASGGDMGCEYPLVFGEDNLANCRVIKEDGRVVSHVGVSVRDAFLLGCCIRVASIGAVCTDAAYRGKGHASLLMEDARRLSLEAGASLMLISGGRGLYHRLGYVTVGAFPSFRVAAESLPPAVPGLRVAPCGAADIPALCALYQRRPVRFVRPVDDWEKLLRAEMLMNTPADCLGIWEGDRLEAYAATQRPRTGPDGRLRAATILEHAGAETALFAGLASVAAHCGAAQLEVVPQPASEDLPRLLRAAGAEEREVAFPGTLGILDAGRFFAAIAPYIGERLGPLAARLRIDPLEGGGACFRLGDETYALESMGRLTALVFGGATEEARDVPPAPPALANAFARLFPLPLLWYGLNYV